MILRARPSYSPLLRTNCAYGHQEGGKLDVEEIQATAGLTKVLTAIAIAPARYGIGSELGPALAPMQVILIIVQSRLFVLSTQRALKLYTTFILA